MSPKRKIPSRKLPTRKFASSQAAKPAAKTRPLKRPPAPKPSKPAAPAASVSKVPQCLWDMGFEALPTLEELRQRYKELSLVLHPDAGGNKQAFVDLRTNYETALSLFKK